MTRRVTMDQVTNLGRTWWAITAEGEWFGEYAFLALGDGDEPDWGLIDDACLGEDEPEEVVAFRFVPGSWSYFERHLRRRWYGLTEHEWEPDGGETGPDRRLWCVNCEASPGTALHSDYCNAPNAYTPTPNLIGRHR